MLCSVRSTVTCYVQFCNKTPSEVDVLWIDFKGGLQKFSTLTPGGEININTYTDHPWISKDRNSQRNLLLNNEPVFYATEEFHNNSDKKDECLTRQQVSITVPSGPILRSLPALFACSIEFWNRSGRFVDVIWINAVGKQEALYELSPNERIEFNTYAGHPWVSSDHENRKMNMLLNGNSVFFPVISNTEEEKELVVITLPVFRLEDRCIEVISDHIMMSDVTSLDIPLLLKKKITEQFNYLRYFMPFDIFTEFPTVKLHS